MAEAASVSMHIKDDYITTERVFSYFKKQRLIHLRQVAGQAKRKAAQTDNGNEVPLFPTTRIASRVATSQEQPRGKQRATGLIIHDRC